MNTILSAILDAKNKVDNEIRNNILNSTSSIVLILIFASVYCTALCLAQCVLMISIIKLRHKYYKMILKVDDPQIIQILKNLNSYNQLANLYSKTAESDILKIKSLVSHY